jgi:hypothetical protein
MGFLEAIGLGVLVVLIGLAGLFVRRGLFARGGGLIEVSVRLSSRVPGRGWAPGFGRFVGDELRWYRMFSFALRPRRIFSRRQLAVQARRRPEGAELLGLPAGSVVLRCATPRSPVEMAMTEGALTGFLSWLEAAPPGATSRRLVG